MIKMLSTVRDKMLNWKAKRAEKQFAQLRVKNTKLVQQLAESLKDDKHERTPVKQGSNSEIKRPLGVNE